MNYVLFFWQTFLYLLLILGIVFLIRYLIRKGNKKNSF